MNENHSKYKKFNVLVIFQPAEESIGGAKVICESGALTRHNVSKVFGLHVWPKIKRTSLAAGLAP